MTEGISILKDFPLENNSKCNLVEVPSCSSWNSFRKNVYKKTSGNWVSLILDAVGGINKNQNDCEIEEDVDHSQVALWMLKYLGKRYGDEFVEAAQHIGMPMCRKPMSAVQTAAMWDSSGTSYASQRVICSYFKQHFGFRFCAAESDVRGLGSTCVPPM